jgi:hypothetical protein
MSNYLERNQVSGNELESRIHTMLEEVLRAAYDMDLGQNVANEDFLLPGDGHELAMSVSWWYPDRHGHTGVTLLREEGIQRAHLLHQYQVQATERLKVTLPAVLPATLLDKYGINSETYSIEVRPLSWCNFASGFLLDTKSDPGVEHVRVWMAILIRLRVRKINTDST